MVTLVRAIVRHHHRAGGDHALARLKRARVHPVAFDRVLVHLHVGVQSFAIVKLFHALFAFKRVAMLNVVSHGVAHQLIALLALVQLAGMSVGGVSMSGTFANDKRKHKFQHS